MGSIVPEMSRLKRVESRSRIQNTTSSWASNFAVSWKRRQANTLDKLREFL